MNQSIHQHFLYIKELNLFGKKPESSCTCREAEGAAEGAAEGEAEGADCPQPTGRAVCFDPLPATLSGEKILCKGRRGNQSGIKTGTLDVFHMDGRY